MIEIFSSSFLNTETIICFYYHRLVIEVWVVLIVFVCIWYELNFTSNSYSMYQDAVKIISAHNSYDSRLLQKPSTYVWCEMPSYYRRNHTRNSCYCIGDAKQYTRIPNNVELRYTSTLYIASLRL